MSGKERVTAALLLVVAVAGGALIPRLLASPPTSVGIALAPGPSPSVVQAPAIARVQHAARPQRTFSPSSQVVARPASTPVNSVAPVVVRPEPATSVALPKTAFRPTAKPSTTPLRPQPLAETPAPLAAGPPTPVAPVPAGLRKTPPGHGGTPPGQARTPPGQAHVPPGHAKHGPDLPGSWGGEERSQQAPPYPVGPHHRGVGHLAPPPARPAPPAPPAGPQARPEARCPHDKGGHEPSPQVTHGRDRHGH
jgi:hypothetical protein